MLTLPSSCLVIEALISHCGDGTVEAVFSCSCDVMSWWPPRFKTQPQLATRPRLQAAKVDSAVRKGGDNCLVDLCGDALEKQVGGRLNTNAAETVSG